MLMSGIDILQLTSREFILGKTSPDELVSFIEDQIKSPFDSGGTNYFHKLCRKLSSDDELDDICAKFITQIQDRYPGLEIDLNDYDQHLSPIFNAIYKFFVKNVSTVMYLFIREFLFNNKNRKGLVSEFNTSKVATYPKEQYGKKEYYILVTKLRQIIDEIFEGDVSLKKFIEYVKRHDDPMYVTTVEKALEDGIVIDSGVVADMYKLYKKSDGFRGDINRLEMDINATFILPYLEENGMMSVRIPPTEELVPELPDDEDGEDDSDGQDA